MANVADTLGATGDSASKFVRYQAGQLHQTMVRLTPPKNRAKTNAAIERRVDAKFHTLRNPAFDHTHSGSDSVEWYGFQPNAIFGVAKDSDMTKASADDLYQFYFKTRLNKQGRIVAGRRGKQTVYIWQKVTTKESTVNRLKARLKRHIGRLKAAWLPSWEELGRPGKPPAQWIARHAEGARGYAINGLGIKGHPQFTMANRALGAGKLHGIAMAAMRLRSKAMLTDMRLIIAGKKRAGWL